jgi:hypothetical protein
MYKLLPIFLFALLFCQNDFDSYLKNYPSTVNKQDIYKEAWYKLYCSGDTINVDDEMFDLEGTVLPEYITLSFSNILNPENYIIKIDSVYFPGFFFKLENKDGKIHTKDAICTNKRILDDYYFWRSIGFIKDIKGTIFIDNSTDIYLTKNIVDDIISDLFPFVDCIDCIKYKSVDIEKLFQQKDQNTQSKISRLNRDDIYDDSWAVIIGIDKYKYSDQLNYAVKDAEAVKDMLIDKFDYPEENIRYLFDEEATLSNKYLIFSSG